LPTEYFHVVFTLPQPIAAIAFYNRELVYDILFHATAETLLTIAADPQHMGVATGFFNVLHIWGQTLHFHPHLHCVVPAGGLSPDHERWIPGSRKFLLPVKVLSARFRHLFLDALEVAYAAAKLQFLGDLTAFARYRAPLRDKKWVVRVAVVEGKNLRRITMPDPPPVVPRAMQRAGKTSTSCWRTSTGHFIVCARTASTRSCSTLSPDSKS
jgi:hypothetical protein